MQLVIDHIAYHVERWGGGAPLLALHGFTGSGRTWRPFQQAWGNDFQVIAPDLIGHGRTDSPNEVRKYAIEQVAHQLAKMIDLLQLEKVHLLGYSMGGRLAITFALMYPEKVDRLIIESASPGLKTAGERAARREQDAKLCEKIAANGIEAFVNAWEEIPLFASQKQLPKEVRAAVREERLQQCETGLIHSLQGMGTGAQPSWWDELGKLEALLITGSLDKKFCHIAEEMSQLLKTSEWVNVTGAGHAIHVEKREIFGTIVSEFLKK